MDTFLEIIKFISDNEHFLRELDILEIGLLCYIISKNCGKPKH
jgi:hypothetical protein